MVDFNRKNTADYFKRLLFRRQFILGPKEYIPNHFWSSFKLSKECYLSIHSDLKCVRASSQGVNAILIGIAIDPYNPERDEATILNSLVENYTDILSYIEFTKPLAGRWVIILQDNRNIFLFTDPCGWRQVYYYYDGTNVWCASQPELIAKNTSLLWNTNDMLLQFLMNPEFSRNESAWIGSHTIYENCYHLMPNHYLDTIAVKQVRFYPTNELPVRKTYDIIRSAASILKGIIMAITYRNSAIVTLTSGWDSRVLLAATKDVSKDIVYYVDKMGIFNDDHPDVWVPRKLSKKLNIELKVENSNDNLPGWFVSILANNITNVRVMPKTKMIYNKLRNAENRVNINGSGSEICRNFFDKYCNIDQKEIGSEQLVRLFGFKSAPIFAVQEIDNWRMGLDVQFVSGLSVLDLLYWEQRMGNWGTQYAAEQDIAVEDISPFNCRLLIETLLSSPRHMRSAPDFPIYRELINAMWPEVLSYPINPKSNINFISTLKRGFRSYIPNPVIKMLKICLKKNSFK
jgi:hypothetical protein